MHTHTNLFAEGCCEPGWLSKCRYVIRARRSLTDSPKPPSSRVTLTLPAINSAEQVSASCACFESVSADACVSVILGVHLFDEARGCE